MFIYIRQKFLKYIITQNFLIFIIYYIIFWSTHDQNGWPI
jgi:hypothetical protein